MANPNPCPETRFSSEKQPASPGRGSRKGCRDKLSKDFLEALSTDFAEHGTQAIKDMRAKDPASYVRVFAGILPKEIEMTSPLDDWSDDELERAFARLRQQITTTEESK